MQFLDENRLNDNENPLFPHKKRKLGLNQNILKT
jgi:hypothetical protein